MLNNYKFVTENYTISNFDSNFERIQTRFCKYVFNISKFASNHGIRAELGRYPLSIVTETKLIKYWHRLENF